MKKRKMMITIAVILTVVLAGSQIGYAANADYGINSLNTRRLNYWYSDVPTNGEYKLGRFEDNTASLQVNKLNVNIMFHFSAGMKEARTKWEDALNITISTVSTSASSADIRFWGGTTEEINALGIFVVGSGVTGNTTITEVNDSEDWIYGGTTIDAVIHKRVTGYIIDNDRSADSYIKTCIHELGHALGWRGHSSVTSDIMYSIESEVTTLTNRDKLHLSQAYNRSDY